MGICFQKQCVSHAAVGTTTELINKDEMVESESWKDLTVQVKGFNFIGFSLTILASEEPEAQSG